MSVNEDEVRQKLRKGQGVFTNVPEGLKVEHWKSLCELVIEELGMELSIVDTNEEDCEFTVSHAQQLEDPNVWVLVGGMFALAGLVATDVAPNTMTVSWLDYIVNQEGK